MEKQISCPLCHEENAIFQTSFKQVTNVRPAEEGVIGNVSLDWSGGQWDYSHAKKCPSLQYVIRKENLLAYHVHGYPTPSVLSDLLSIDDYNKQLKQWELEIGNFSKKIC